MTIPFHKASLGNEEIQAVSDVIRSGWITMGPKTIEFEEDFKKFIDAKYALAVNSATSALHLALKSVGLKEGDEVIIPTNTFVATAEVVTYFNAIPILCDIERESHNIDVSKIENLITSKTKVIIPVHFSGIPCDMDEIMEISKKYSLFVVEDAAHALPSHYKGKIVGGIGHITCFSFYATKTLATGEGGMLVTNNIDFYNSCKINRLHGIQQDAWERYSKLGKWFYNIVDNGYKYNTTDMNSALGVVQLKKVEKMANKREIIAKKYDEGFRNNDDIETLVFPKSLKRSSWHLYVIKVRNRDGLISYLNDRDIGCSVHFIPIYRHIYYKNKYNFRSEDYPVSEAVFESCVSLPIYPDLTDSDIGEIINATNSFFN
jgi:dTDP-4-amino-4,6-dideoxygalactose transaminase